MASIQWNLTVFDMPRLLRHCKKCGRPQHFASSGMFRVNARHHTLDVWLIYKCETCDSTWKLEIHNRVHPRSLDARTYDGYMRNDEALARQCAFDRRLLQRCGGTVAWDRLAVTVAGPDIDLTALDEPVTVSIESEYALRIRADRILRQKLGLSRAAYDRLIRADAIRFEGRATGKSIIEEGITVVLAPCGEAKTSTPTGSYPQDDEDVARKTGEPRRTNAQAIQGFAPETHEPTEYR